MKINSQIILFRIGYIKAHSSMENYFKNLILPVAHQYKKAKYNVFFHSYNKVPDFNNIRFFIHNRKSFFNLIGILIDDLQVLFFRLKFHNRVLIVNINQLLPTFLSSKYSIVIIHDLIPYEFKNYWFLLNLYYKYFLKFYCRKVAHIVTISETSKNKITKFFNIDLSFITTIYNGIKFTDSESIEMSTPNNSFLYVGANMPHKNIERLADVFLKLGDQFSIQFVGSCCKNEHLKAISSIAKNIHLLNSVSDKQLSELYLNSYALIFPSFSEGFGLPLVEAMFYGKPILVSKMDYALEICKNYNNTYYFDPFDIDSIVNTILKFSRLDKRIAIIKDNINNRSTLLNKYSWSNSQTSLIKLISIYLHR